MSKVVIVTGGAGGLGREIAIQFGLTGAKVVVNYVAHLDDAEVVAEKINGNGGEAFVYKSDVCDLSQVQSMADATVRRWGRIDVLVNNAGGGAGQFGGTHQVVAEMDEWVWDKVVGVNLKGTFLCIKAVAPVMMKQGDGHIINVSSATGLRGRDGRAAYASAKAGVIGLTKSVARELADYNIKVNAVCPGHIHHDRAVRRGRANPDGDYQSRNLLHRASGSAREFAEFLVHLSTMNNISGQTLNLDSRIVF
jgi:3-oxoacyl-[acyl-carrier protein] reductase